MKLPPGDAETAGQIFEVVSRRAVRALGEDGVLGRGALRCEAVEQAIDDAALAVIQRKDRGDDELGTVEKT
ncbi:MAG: hypothetical protein WDN49_06930 [Acetobacteraceae bacterium]